MERSGETLQPIYGMLKNKLGYIYLRFILRRTRRRIQRSAYKKQTDIIYIFYRRYYTYITCAHRWGKYNIIYTRDVSIEEIYYSAWEFDLQRSPTHHCIYHTRIVNLTFCVHVLPPMRHPLDPYDTINKTVYMTIHYCCTFLIETAQVFRSTIEWLEIA